MYQGHLPQHQGSITGRATEIHSASLLAAEANSGEQQVATRSRTSKTLSTSVPVSQSWRQLSHAACASKAVRLDYEAYTVQDLPTVVLH